MRTPLLNQEGRRGRAGVVFSARVTSYANVETPGGGLRPPSSIGDRRYNPGAQRAPFKGYAQEPMSFCIALGEPASPIRTAFRFLLTRRHDAKPHRNPKTRVPQSNFSRRKLTLRYAICDFRVSSFEFPFPSFEFPVSSPRPLTALFPASHPSRLEAFVLLREIPLKVLQNRARNIQWFRVATAALAIVFGLNLCRPVAKVGVNLDEL